MIPSPQLRQISSWAVLMAVVACQSQRPPATSTSPPSPETRASQTRLGTAVSWHAIKTDARYAPFLTQHFQAATFENATKWATVEASPGKWDWSRAEDVLAVVEPAGFHLRGHPLVWDEHVPSWATHLEADAFRDASDTFASAVVSRFRDQVDEWDVVNELIEDDGRISTAPLFSRRGPGQAEAAFQLARELAPEALLFYNDDAIAWDNLRSRGVEAMVRRWRAEGVPIDGVGMEMHLLAGQAPPEETVRERIRAFASLGVQVAITELDVRTAHLHGSARGRELVQARAYWDAVHACVTEPACEAVTLWGFTDRHSPWDEAERAHPLDEHYQPKAAWGAIQAALNDEAPPYCATNLIDSGSTQTWTANGAHLTSSPAGDAMQVTRRSAEWAGPQIDVTDGVASGGLWRVQASVSTDSTSVVPLQWTLRSDYPDAPSTYTVLWQGQSTPGSTTQADGSGLLTLSGAPERVRLYLEGPPAGISLTLENIRFSAACPEVHPSVAEM